MTIVGAYLLPGLPHPLLKPDVSTWSRFGPAAQKAGRSLAGQRPDTLVVYSTQWVAVLDQLWQTRPQVSGVHVDENWYEWGDLSYDIRIDTELSFACLAASARHGITSKGVNYDGFPIDTGTILANRWLNPDGRLAMLMTSNNIYHDWAQTERLGGLVATVAKEQNRRIAVIGVGGMSGGMFRHEIDPREDRIVDPEDDRRNRRMLDLLERGDVEGVRREMPAYAKDARADMGFKHLAWILGALGGRFYGARVHAYGAIWGSGAAVVEFRL